jgi:D-alanyl-D-alanine carboxypeptidase/D-alanyl-D-alanine-endopeptidase (penicillin-binding protein 4)
MRLPVIRRAAVLAGCALVACTAVAAPSANAAPLPDRVNAVIRRSSVSATSSVYVWDQASRDVIYTRGASRSVTPASTMKLLTSAAALQRFGADHTFETKLALVGHQDGSTWVGDVWLIGGGDPSLSTFGFLRDNYRGVGSNLAVLVSPLRARGITSIDGRMMVDDDLFDAVRWVPEWKSSFRYEESGALGALTVNQSLTGKWVGTDSAHAPDLRAGVVYRDLLRRQGITVTGATVSGSAPADAEIVGTLPSPPLGKLLEHMLQESDNFYAETLLKDIAADRYGDGASTAEGRAVAERELERIGVNMDAATWVDGSGLAYGNKVTARVLGHTLGVGAQAPWGETWIGAFAQSGTSGTLRKRMKTWPYRGRVHAKTGTLLHSSALAGFSERLGSGHRYGFVVVTSMPVGRQVNYTAARSLQDRVAMVLVR